MNTTTKRYARSIAEAFPTGTEYANAIERYRRVDFSGLTIVGFCGVALACLIVWVWL